MGSPVVSSSYTSTNYPEGYESEDLGMSVPVDPESLVCEESESLTCEAPVDVRSTDVDTFARTRGQSHAGAGGAGGTNAAQEIDGEHGHSPVDTLGHAAHNGHSGVLAMEGAASARAMLSAEGTLLRTGLGQVRAATAVAATLEAEAGAAGGAERGLRALVSTRAGQVLTTAAESRFGQALEHVAHSRSFHVAAKALVVGAAAYDAYTSVAEEGSTEGNAARAVGTMGTSALMYTNPVTAATAAVEHFAFDGKPHVSGPLRVVPQVVGTLVETAQGDEASLNRLADDMANGRYGGVIAGLSEAGAWLGDRAWDLHEWWNND